MSDREKLKRTEIIKNIRNAKTAEEQKKIVDAFMKEPIPDDKGYKRMALFNFKDKLAQLTVDAHYLQNEGIENIILLDLLNKIETEILNLIERIEDEER